MARSLLQGKVQYAAYATSQILVGTAQTYAFGAGAYHVFKAAVADVTGTRWVLDLWNWGTSWVSYGLGWVGSGIDWATGGLFSDWYASFAGDQTLGSILETGISGLSGVADLLNNVFTAFGFPLGFLAPIIVFAGAYIALGALGRVFKQRYNQYKIDTEIHNHFAGHLKRAGDSVTLPPANVASRKGGTGLFFDFVSIGGGWLATLASQLFMVPVILGFALASAFSMSTVPTMTILTFGLLASISTIIADMSEIRGDLKTLHTDLSKHYNTDSSFRSAFKNAMRTGTADSRAMERLGDKNWSLWRWNMAISAVQWAILAGTMYAMITMPFLIVGSTALQVVLGWTGVVYFVLGLVRNRNYDKMEHNHAKRMLITSAARNNLG